MLLFEGTSIKKQLQDRLLFYIDLMQVHDNQRIGLVGRNGTGKTSLLKIITGEELPDEGNITPFTSVKLVPQFKESRLEKSGGEITQQYLQKAFNENPGLLLLDEPTTHLDTERIAWLEKKIRNYQGATVVVSHDRAFLNNVCTEIWEIENNTFKIFKGNYDEYAKQKDLLKKQEQTEFEKYEREKQKLKRAIRQKEERAQRATKKPKNLSSSEARIKGTKTHYANIQKKLRGSAKALETRLEQLDKVDKVKELPEIKMDMLNEEKFTNQSVLRAENVKGEIGGSKLWDPFTFYLYGGDKVAIIGKNGSGKTALLKKIVKQDEGFTIPKKVKIGYFSQHLTILNDEQSIIENVQSSSSQNETLIRTVLARMHFWDEDVYKKVGILSGGEKVKLALAKLFLSDVNMLVLDEPTNFLDIISLEALETLMKSYHGTILFVTHDRMLVKNIATKIIDIKDGKITVFDGSYEAYEEWLENKTKSKNDDQILLIETKISDVLGRLSLEPSQELEDEFQRLLKEKKELTKKL
ncbi:Vga family ABC-F type ribosomal protection protein [Abyssicoccus albus]|mgnify:CR=1 FL=1|uniref:Pleuromutilin/lincosamide/streptogramin A transport system ATP-binding/permease protein n=1 Tax=Abyssicoccus albus TaxID=1817405 RepID=A0A3N5C9C4_9BACL|nr:Vga family ABC-F type ribosomal protection protein [Abyssicoccus albus]RPF55155.1 pleuromutilin/lincosamide/streptogramin A transport system ATP-binding/permease protein [Abyssicoccus albus]